MDLISILFFISFAGIIYMIGRKLWVLKKAGTVIEEKELVLIEPDFESVKYLAIRKLKKYGYIVILITLRLSVRASNYLKQKWAEQMEKIMEKIGQKDPETLEEREISKFLKTVSDYKKKIKTIKEKVREEEGLM